MFGSGKRRSVHGVCSSGSRKKKIIECTHERHTLLSYKAGRYYQQCYDNQPSQISSAEKKKKCNRSINGCSACIQTICKECWDAGYDNVRHRPRIT